MIFFRHTLSTFLGYSGLLTNTDRLLAAESPLKRRRVQKDSPPPAVKKPGKNDSSWPFDLFLQSLPATENASNHRSPPMFAGRHQLDDAVDVVKKAENMLETASADAVNPTTTRLSTTRCKITVSDEEINDIS
jgi:hypothetical protein